MRTYNKLWNDGEVKISSRGYGRGINAQVTTVEGAVKSLKDMKMHACCLTAGWNKQEGCYLKLKDWCNPYSCPTMSDRRMELCFRRPCPEFVWTRSESPPAQDTRTRHGMWESNETMMIAAGFDALFRILLEMYIQKLVVTELSHDLAGEIMAGHFKLALQLGNRSTPAIEFPGHGLTATDGARRELTLCCHLIRNGPKRIAYERLGKKYSKAEISRLLKATQSSKNLEDLDLRLFLPVDGNCMEYPVEHKGPYMRTSDGYEAGAPVSPLVSALASRDCTITELNLGGLLLAPTSAMELALQLGSFRSVKRLGLRATGLTEETLVVLLEKGLASNDTLKELDISWNGFTPKVMQALCNALKANHTLRKLRVEHCGIDYDLVRMLSAALCGFQGIQHLSLNGNEFTWTPLVCEGIRELWSDAAITSQDSVWCRGSEINTSMGIARLVEGMENNHSLWGMQVGEYGHLAPIIRACCSPPRYTEHMGMFTRYNLQNLFGRNRRSYPERQWLRTKLAVVRIADILLSKMDRD